MYNMLYVYLQVNRFLVKIIKYVDKLYLSGVNVVRKNKQK